MDTFIRPGGTRTEYFPSRIGPPAVWPWPSAGTKVMDPSSTGVPSTVTVPDTSASPDPSHPAARAAHRASPPNARPTRMTTPVRNPVGRSEVRHHLAPVHRPQGLPGG